MAPPVPGTIPMNTPSSAPTVAALANPRISPSDGQIFFTLCSRTSARAPFPCTCVSTSLTANTPMSTASCGKPIISLPMPNVNRLDPASGSVPTVDTSSPNAPLISPLIMFLPEEDAMIVSPNSASAK